MITRVKGSTFRTVDNFAFVSLADLAPQNTDVTTLITAQFALGNPIFVPVGTWNISGISVPDNGIIFGLGEKSILKQIVTANTVAVTVGSNCLVQNFLVDGNKANQVGTGFHGFLFANSVDSQGIQLYAKNCKGSGFKISGAAVSEVQLIECASVGHTESGFLVDSGSNIALIAPRATLSDAVATGDGIAIASNGTVITNVTIADPISRNQAGRGISILGNGSKNVTSVSVSNPQVSNNTGNGIHLINVDGASVLGGMSNNNGIDGLRIEGDVQNCRFAQFNCRNNVAFGAREVVSGSTPNFNGLIYGITSGNGNNTITKVGASSYVV